MTLIGWMNTDYFKLLRSVNGIFLIQAPALPGPRTETPIV